jgi:hypothetical protein
MFLDFLHGHFANKLAERLFGSALAVTVQPRSREHWPSSPAKTIALPGLGGLHHRYSWLQAA